MNSSVNPCEDFYEYSCGGWAASHAIPEWKSRTGVTEELEDTQREEIRKQLEKFNLKEKTNMTFSASVTLSAHLYQSCVHLGKQTPEVGVEKLFEVVSSIRGGAHKAWRLGQRLKPEEEKALPKWEEGLVELFANGAIDAIFSVSISPDPKNVSELLINVRRSLLESLIILTLLFYTFKTLARPSRPRSRREGPCRPDEKPKTGHRLQNTNPRIC